MPIVHFAKGLSIFQFNFDLEKHTENYKTRKVYCLNCGKEIKGKDRFKRKFCCKSCATSYNNKQGKDLMKSKIDKFLDFYNKL